MITNGTIAFNHRVNHLFMVKPGIWMPLLITAGAHWFLLIMKLFFRYLTNLNLH